MEKAYELVLMPQGEGGFTVVVPELPDIATEGETIKQAIVAARDAIEGYLEALAAHGWSPPATKRAHVVVEVPAT